MLAQLKIFVTPSSARGAAPTPYLNPLASWCCDPLPAPKPAAIEATFVPWPLQSPAVAVIGAVLYIGDAAGARHHAVRVEVGVAGGRRAVVEPRVGHVDRKVERRGKSLHPQPRQIPRTRRLAPGGQIPSHDLRAPLVEEPRHRIGHDRDDRGIGCERVHLGAGQLDELGREPSYVGIGSRAHPGGRDRPPGIRAVRARQRLNRHEPRVAARRHALAQLVGARHPRDRAHRRNGPDEAGQPLDLVPARVHDVRVLRHVLHDPGAAVAKAVEPGILDRSRRIGRLRGSRRDPLRPSPPASSRLRDGSNSPPGRLTSRMSSRRSAPALRRSASSSPRASTSVKAS